MFISVETDPVPSRIWHDATTASFIVQTCKLQIQITTKQGGLNKIRHDFSLPSKPHPFRSTNHTRTYPPAVNARGLCFGNLPPRERDAEPLHLHRHFFRFLRAAWCGTRHSSNTMQQLRIISRHMHTLIADWGPCLPS